MSVQSEKHSSSVNWLTTIAIAAIAISLTIAFHEGIHALTCVVVGGDLQEYSALHVSCENSNLWREKVVSGSASIANLIIGFVFLFVLRRSRQASSERHYFFWLFMLLNWLNGAGYWIFSGIANFGDWATVITGWEPNWLWHILMAFLGTGLYAFFVWLALKELGKIIGGNSKEQIGRAVKLGLFSYLAVFLVILLASFFNPYGMASSPVIGGLMAAIFGMSPLLWMMQWFRAKSFEKLSQPALEIRLQWPWIISALIIVFAYAFILGRTLYF